VAAEVVEATEEVEAAEEVEAQVQLALRLVGIPSP
jgi:hypothetical protein